jgi:hypothetical protein
VLFHEKTSEPVLKALLEGQWRAGFSHWRLVSETESRHVFYVCKYLGKDIPTRVWNSSRYGHARIADQLVELMRDTSENESSPVCRKQEVTELLPAPTSDKFG